MSQSDEERTRSLYAFRVWASHVMHVEVDVMTLTVLIHALHLYQAFDDLPKEARPIVEAWLEEMTTRLGELSPELVASLRSP